MRDFFKRETTQMGDCTCWMVELLVACYMCRMAEGRLTFQIPWTITESYRSYDQVHLEFCSWHIPKTLEDQEIAVLNDIPESLRIMLHEEHGSLAGSELELDDCNGDGGFLRITGCLLKF